MKVYFFGWPGALGGADTKLALVLPLLCGEFEVTVVPEDASCLGDWTERRRLKALGVACALLNELPDRLDGWGVAICNAEFISSGQAAEARRRGLRLAWSNEMMWTFREEHGALILGLFDAVLYVSEAQRRALEPHYRRMLSGESSTPTPEPDAGAREGWINGGQATRKLRWVMNGNYIDPAQFPFRDRAPENSPGQPLVVGRLSRADPHKFPPDFPQFYENLGLKNPQFRIMGWNEEMAACWPRHHFDERWKLLPPLAEPTGRFLQSLDLFVYSLHARFRESWGRVVVEAMLTGAIPLLPTGAEHHLQSLVEHGSSGFLCQDSGEFGRFARELENNPALRHQISRQARARAEKLCDADEHRRYWRQLFYGGT